MSWSPSPVSAQYAETRTGHPVANSLESLGQPPGSDHRLIPLGPARSFCCPAYHANPMPKSNILELLVGGDRRSIGRADEVATAVLKNMALFPALMKGWWSESSLVRMRAADATEKVTRNKPLLLDRYRKELLGLMAEAKQKELRWHLAAIVPRLSLDAKERTVVSSLLRGYLEDDSSIVKTSALQALADLAADEPSMQPEVIDLLRQSARDGTPAMRARSRKLLLQLERRFDRRS